MMLEAEPSVGTQGREERHQPELRLPATRVGVRYPAPDNWWRLNRLSRSHRYHSVTRAGRNPALPPAPASEGEDGEGAKRAASEHQSHINRSVPTGGPVGLMIIQKLNLAIWCDLPLGWMPQSGCRAT